MTFVGYADITALADQYQSAGVSAKAAAQQVVAQAVTDVEAYAREYAPTRTGALRASITSWVDGSGLTGVISASAPYALFVEFGTGTRGEFPGQMITIRPKSPNGMLKWTGSDGKTHYAKVVHSPGMKARPFMRPGLTDAIDALAGDLANAVITSVVKGPNA